MTTEIEEQADIREFLEHNGKLRLANDTLVIELTGERGQGMSYNAILMSKYWDELWKSYSGSQ